jgi:integrase/recombinase XerC
MNIANALDRFTRQLAANGRSGHTQAAYRRDLAALARWLKVPSLGKGGNPDLGKITPDTLARFLTSDAVLLTPSGDPATAGEPRSPMSVNRTKSALRSFFAFCVESGWIRENPARLIRSSPATPKEPTTLTEREIGRLRTILGQETGPVANRDRLAFEILLGTGIRLGSLVSLNVGDVDLKQGTLHIKSKGGRQERVFLNALLVRMLGRFLREVAPQGNGGPDVPLIRSIHGRRLGARQVQLRFAKWCREAGISPASGGQARPVSVHSTRLYHRTGDLHLVQRALGHRQITTTEVYARVSDDSLRRAVASRN